MKNCPYCNSEILDEAVFCVHCKSSLSSNVVEETNPNVKRCTYCGNECDKNAVLCVKCGSVLENNTNKKKINKSINKLTLIYIVNIGFCALGVVSLLITLLTNRFDISTFGTTIASIIVLVGLIIGKKNKIVSVGYGISALLNLISLFTGMKEIYIVTSVISVVQISMIALLYAGNRTLKKMWYMPTILSFLSATILIIFSLANSAYTYEGYYSSYFDWEYFLLEIVVQFSPIIGVILTSLNAKMNWYREE